MNLRLVACSIFALCGLNSSLVWAQVGSPAASPSAITVSSPTVVTVTSRITAPNVIPGSVNVLQIDSSGHATIVGQLHDDGLNGDLVAGDGTYSGLVTLTASQTGTVGLQISAATRGSLRRTLSTATPLDVLPVGIPTKPAPPDLTKTTVDPSTGQTILADQVLACFSSTTTVSTIISIGQKIGGTIAGRLSGLGNCYQFNLGSSSTASTVTSAINTLNSDSEVLSAEADIVRTISSAPCANPPLPTCSDPSYSHLDLDVAHGIATGLGTSVAVVDTGVDYNNQTLNPASHRVIKGPNTVTNVPDPIDNLGHGTHVAGIVAATAPNAVIYAVKVFDKDKSGNIVGDAVAGAWGIKAAADAGANVINMSYSDTRKSVWENLAIQYAWLKGCVLVAAAGNHSSSVPEFPAAYQNVLSIGNLDDSDFIAPSSNFGKWVLLGAPGVNVTSTWLNGQTNILTGTSQAAPFVSGTAALVRSKFNFDNTAVVNQLEQTAKQIANNPDGAPNMDVGSGRLDPVAALSGMRISHTGFTPFVDVSVTVTDGNTVVSSNTFTFGPVGTETAEFTVPFPPGPGQFKAEVFLSTPGVDFGIKLDLTPDRLSFPANGCIGGNSSITSPTEALAFLNSLGFVPTLRSTTCTINAQ